MKLLRSLVPLLLLLSAVAASAQDTREPRTKPAMSIASSSVRAMNHTPQCTESPVPPGKPRDEYYVVNCADNMDVYIFNDESPIIIDIPFTRVIGKLADLKKNKLISDTLKIEIMAFDIDDVVDPETGLQAERDRVTFNNHVLGYLDGKNNEWSITKFEIPIEWVRFPTFTNGPVNPEDNRLKVEIDTGNEYPVWAVQIDYVTASFTATRPVLLVHGILTTGATWQRKLQFAGTNNFFQHPRTWEEENNFLGVPTIDVDLPLHGTQDIEGNAAKVGQYVELLRQRTGAQKVIIQSHSKGGIDSRHYVETHDTVEKLFMMGTSHAGSPLADVIDYVLKKIGLQSFIANLVPIQEILTSKYMNNYNATHGHNPAVAYRAQCGRYQGGWGTKWWEYLLMGIVGDGDTIVPVESCLALDFVQPGWVMTWGNNRASQHTSLCASYTIHWMAFQHLQIRGIFSNAMPGSIAAMDVRRTGSQEEEDLHEETGITVPTDLQPAKAVELAPPVTGRLTLGQVTTFPIPIDEAGRNAFTMMYAGGDLQLNLISPSGTRYTPTSTFPPNAGYDESSFFDAPIAVYHFDATETGLWTGEVVANTITHASGQGEYAFRMMMVEATAKIEVGLAKDTVRLNESLRPRVTLKRNNIPMLGLTVKADVFRGPTQIGTVTLHDDGTTGDAVPGDGTYTGDFAGTTAAGRYDFLFAASDDRVGALPFSRSGMVTATVTASLSTIVGPFSDVAYDVDDDDGLDVIEVEAHVLIDRAGTYRAYGELKDSTGLVVSSTSQVINSGAAGTGSFRLKFGTADIYTLQRSGPYRVSFKLSEETVNSIGVIHELPNAHTTSAYQWYRFQPPPPAALEDTEIVTSQVQTIYGGTVSPTATLTTKGQPLAGKKVNFSINYASLGTAITDENGVARLIDAKVPMYYAAKQHALTVAFAGDPIYAASTDTKVFWIFRTAQVIDWENPGDILPGTLLSEEQLNATITVPTGGQPGGELVYDPPAETELEEGTHTLTVTALANPYYNEATKTVQIRVGRPLATVNWTAPAPITYGTLLGSTQLNASSPTGGQFLYSPPAGTKLNAGTHTLYVTFYPSGFGQTPVQKTVTLVVNKAAQTITWANPAPINYGTALTSAQLNATTTTGGGTITYNPAAGTLLDVGTRTLTANAAATTNYTAATATVTLTVNPVAPTLSWLAPAPITYGTPLGETQLGATASVAGTFAYSPAAGTILGAGTHTLNVTFTPSAGNHTPKSASVSLTVNKAASTVTWNPPAPIVYGTALGATQLNAAASTAGTFAYTPAAGTILNAGSSQTLSVVFTPADAQNYNGASKSVAIDVAKAAQVITWANPADIVYGTPLGASQLNATTNGGGALTYSPAAGTVLNAGTHTLTANAAATANYNAATKSVSINVAKAPQTIAWSNPADIVYGTPLSATQLNATTNGGGALTYSPAAGTVLNAGTQTLTVNAAATANYLAATKSVSINVAKAAQVITWSNPADLIYGTPLGASQLNAATTGGGTLTYSPAAGTVLDAGTHTLTVTAAETANYNAASKSVSVVVTKAATSIAWSNPADVVYGTPLGNAQLNAITNSGAVLTYSPAAGTALNAGTHTLSVTAAETANYFGASKSVSLVVRKATPVVTWPASAAIVYGTALDSAQFNATANVAGSFAYTPAAGTILNAGAGQPLQAVFTPADAGNYESVTQSTTITVVKAKQTITWSTPAPIVYLTPLTNAQLNATVSVVGPSAAGAIAYDPAAGTVLQAGNEVLRVNVAETANYDAATSTVTLTIRKATPAVTWAAPAPIVYGTPLSGTQLNAAANVPGAFAYSPATGTILNAGAGQTLQAVFTPADTRNYENVTQTTTLDVAKAAQTLAWSAPSSIVYGTPLGGAQLSATVSVVGPALAGSLTYTPSAGTVLDAGRHTLRVAVSETANYLPASAEVALDVTRAPLAVTVASRTKVYGAPLPTLGGAITGVVNNDPIEPAYATAATQSSPAGTYPITATLLDPHGRLANYDVTITPSTLTVTRAALTVTANNVQSQYSDPIPQLTAAFNGLVLGETPAVLAGTLSLQTTATKDSAPGVYPIAIGGLSSPNYDIAFIAGAATIAQEDARVTWIAPTAFPATGATTSVVLGVTIRDISATNDPASDTSAGAILQATVTFFDRATGATLCTAPLGLTGSDTRVATATCAFNAPTGEHRIGVRVGGYYTRDAAADDVVITVATPSSDDVTGGGWFNTTASSGKHAADAGSRVSINTNLSYDKNGALKGKFTVSFVRGGKTYEISGDSAGLLIRRTAEGGVATIVGNAVLRDVAADKVLDASAVLVATLTDRGEPGKTDGAAVLLLAKSGGMLFASKWDGARATEEVLGGGNIQIHYGK